MLGACGIAAVPCLLENLLSFHERRPKRAAFFFMQELYVFTQPLQF